MYVEYYVYHQTLKLPQYSKCFLLHNIIYYLVPSIHHGNLEIAWYTSETIYEMKVNRNMTEIRLFLSLCNAFRRFISNFGRISDLLNFKVLNDQLKLFYELIAK